MTRLPPSGLTWAPITLSGSSLLVEVGVFSVGVISVTVNYFSYCGIIISWQIYNIMLGHVGR